MLASVIHLKTGHVLAAVTAAGLAPTLDDLTGGKAVRVRLPGTDGYVDVPASILAAARISLKTEDVLDHPHDYVVSPGGQALERAGENAQDDAEGMPAVFVWRVEANGVSESIFDLDPKPLKKDGELPRAQPPGARQLLLAYAGGPLTIADAGP